MRKSLIPFALLLPCASPLAAEVREDVQGWASFNLAVPLDETFAGTLEISPRLREGDDQFLVRGALEAEVAEGVMLAGGGAFITSGGRDEWRAHQQVTLSAGPFSSRSRIEQRFLPGADRMQLRLRERVQASFPVAKDTSISGSVELLYIARSETPGGRGGIDNWRFELGARHRFSLQFDAALAYRAIYSPREGAPDRLSHVPVMTLTFRP